MTEPALRQTLGLADAAIAHGLLAPGLPREHGRLLLCYTWA